LRWCTMGNGGDMPGAGADVPSGVLHPIASYNNGMLAQLASGHLCQYEYSEAQKNAFHQGYMTGINDSMVLLGTTIAMCAFCLTLLVPSLYLPVREVVQPWAIARVKAEHSWLMWIQKFHHPVVDYWFQFIGLQCGVGFYITALPFLFWIGEMRLARQLTMFMATCIYVGNALKDTICSPRPDWTKGVKHRTAEDGDTEYGIPSTHTINTIAMYAYLFHHINYYGVDGVTRHPQGRYLYENMDDFKLIALLGMTIAWCSIVAYSRLYLGMHSPIDVISGVVVAGSLVVFWVSCEDFLDAWMTQGWNVPLLQFLFNVALVFAYPKPEKKTPSYTFVVYFLGTSTGVSAGVWASYERFHSPAGVARAHAARGSLFTTAGILWSVRRFLVGIVIVLACRQIANVLAKFLLPRIAAALGIEASDHDAIRNQERARAGTAKKSDDNSGSSDGSKSTSSDPLPPLPEIKGYNSNTGVRVLTYTAVGWAVTLLCPHAFDYLAI